MSTTFSATHATRTVRRAASPQPPPVVSCGVLLRGVAVARGACSALRWVGAPVGPPISMVLSSSPLHPRPKSCSGTRGSNPFARCMQPNPLYPPPPLPACPHPCIPYIYRVAYTSVPPRPAPLRFTLPSRVPHPSTHMATITPLRYNQHAPHTATILLPLRFRPHYYHPSPTRHLGDPPFTTVRLPPYHRPTARLAGACR